MNKLTIDFDTHEVPKLGDRELRLSWVAISYRTVTRCSIALVCLLVAGVWFFFPNVVQKAIRPMVAAVSHVIATFAGGPRSVSASTTSPDGSIAQMARFANLEGTVRVLSKHDSTWATATYNLALAKGDVIQTGADGMAKVVFPDGTSYTLKPDSLIMVQENSTNINAQTQVAVEVTTGTVDLATGLFSQGSRAQVIVAGAVADLKPDSMAAVHNEHSQHDILIKRGGADVSRNGQHLLLARNEKASFQGETAVMAKVSQVSPPVLLAPANELSMLLEGKQDTQFTWAPVDEAKGYRLIVARDASFHDVVLTRFVAAAGAKVSGLETGAYFWSVRSLDGKGAESMESERNKFMLVPQIEQGTLSLSLGDFITHGHILEVTGKADLGARVVVNGEEVPVIDSDGGFHFFTAPLPDGPNQITVVAQNSTGMKRQVRTVVIQ